MTVFLNIIERLHLTNLLLTHGNGNLVTMRMVAGLKEKFGITPQEIEELGIKQEQAGVSIQKNETKQFDLLTTEELFIKTLLKDRSDAKKVTLEEIPLYDAFGITD